MTADKGSSAYGCYRFRDGNLCNSRTILESRLTYFYHRIRNIHFTQSSITTHESLVCYFPHRIDFSFILHLGWNNRFTINLGTLNNKPIPGFI